MCVHAERMTDLIRDFLKQAGWEFAVRMPITSDWSPRQYWRLTKTDGAMAVLLQGPSVPLAGHGLPDFIRLGDHLRHLGLSAPAIYASDIEHNLLLIEDFGATSIDMPSVEADGYGAAVDVLATFRHADALNTAVDDYKDGYIFKKLGLFATNVGNGDVDGWIDAWQQVESQLQPCPYVFSHMDYKAGNLHWLPEREGVRRIGILDFQAAQNAPFTYDIVNLLEDARRNIAPALKAILLQRFEEALPDAWKSFFDDWYVVMAAQFHARVLGQIQHNTHVAPDVAPRLRAYLRHELEHPALKPVRDWVLAHSALLG